MMVFFLATGYFQVKFPRYLMPLYPLAFIFGAALFSNALRTRRSTQPDKSAEGSR
jgi:hypothetical protein